MQVSFSTNDQLMVMAAHRYSLGRRSYIVGSCIEFLDEVWDQLKLNTQEVILRDTKEALAHSDRGDAGAPMDIRAWEQFVIQHPARVGK